MYESNFRCRNAYISYPTSHVKQLITNCNNYPRIKHFNVHNILSAWLTKSSDSTESFITGIWITYLHHANDMYSVRTELLQDADIGLHCGKGGGGVFVFPDLEILYKSREWKFSN